MIQELYDRLKAEIEAQKGVKISRMEVVDDHGVVTITVYPKIENVLINFAESGDMTEPPLDPEAGPTDEGDGIIIEWGDDPEDGQSSGESLLDASAYNLYRSTDNVHFTKIGTTISPFYTDRPLQPGTYYYYVVPVYDNKEGIPSNVVSVTLS